MGDGLYPRRLTCLCQWARLPSTTSVVVIMLQVLPYCTRSPLMLLRRSITPSTWNCGRVIVSGPDHPSDRSRSGPAPEQHCCHKQSREGKTPQFESSTKRSSDLDLWTLPNIPSLCSSHLFRKPSWCDTINKDAGLCKQTDDFTAASSSSRHSYKDGSVSLSRSSKRPRASCRLSCLPHSEALVGGNQQASGSPQARRRRFIAVLHPAHLGPAQKSNQILRDGL